MEFGITNKWIDLSVNSTGDLVLNLSRTRLFRIKVLFWDIAVLYQSCHLASINWKIFNKNLIHSIIHGDVNKIKLFVKVFFIYKTEKGGFVTMLC